MILPLFAPDMEQSLGVTCDGLPQTIRHADSSSSPAFAGTTGHVLLVAGGHQVIIAMTASAMKEDVERCLMAGMDDYLSKPVRLEALQAMLEKYRDPALAEATSQPPVDSDFLVEMTGGDEAFLQEILEEFLKTIPPLLEEVERAVIAGDSRLLARSAHTIKGSARAVGAQRFADIAFDLEQAGKAQNLQHAPDALRALQEEWHRLQEHIRQQFLQRAA